MYIATTEISKFNKDQYRPVIINITTNKISYCGIAFPTEKEAKLYAEDVLSGIRPGFKY